MSGEPTAQIPVSSFSDICYYASLDNPDLQCNQYVLHDDNGNGFIDPEDRITTGSWNNFIWDGVSDEREESPLRDAITKLQQLEPSELHQRLLLMRMARPFVDVVRRSGNATHLQTIKNITLTGDYQSLNVSDRIYAPQEAMLEIGGLFLRSICTDPHNTTQTFQTLEQWYNIALQNNDPATFMVVAGMYLHVASNMLNVARNQFNGANCSDPGTNWNAIHNQFASAQRLFRTAQTLIASAAAHSTAAQPYMPLITTTFENYTFANAEDVKRMKCSSAEEPKAKKPKERQREEPKAPKQRKKGLCDCSKIYKFATSDLSHPGCTPAAYQGECKR